MTDPTEPQPAPPDGPTITLRQLADAGSCLSALVQFRRRFGQSVVLTEANIASHTGPSASFDIEWLAHRLLDENGKSVFTDASRAANATRWARKVELTDAHYREVDGAWQRAGGGHYARGASPAFEAEAANLEEQLQAGFLAADEEYRPAAAAAFLSAYRVHPRPPGRLRP
jgi:hypothetical protein